MKREIQKAIQKKKDDQIKMKKRIQMKKDRAEAAKKRIAETAPAEEKPKET